MAPYARRIRHQLRLTGFSAGAPSRGLLKRGGGVLEPKKSSNVCAPKAENQFSLLQISIVPQNEIRTGGGGGGSPPV